MKIQSLYASWYLLICLSFISTTLSALQVSVDPLVYRGVNQSVVEINYQVVGNTITFDTLLVTAEEQYQAAVDVIILFKQDSTIIQFDKFRLRGPLSSNMNDFIDIRTYGLEPGIYQLDIEFADAADEANVYRFNQELVVPDYQKQEPQFSNIKLLARLQQPKEESDQAWIKNGVVMEPLPHHFYDSRHDFLQFYLELYAADIIEIRPLVLHMEIQREINGEWITKQQAYQRLEQYRAVEPFARKLSLQQLPSDYYRFRVSLIDAKKNEYLKKQIFFYYSNPENDSKLIEQKLESSTENFFRKLSDDSLEYALRAIAPVIPSTDQPRVNYLVSKGTQDMKADFLYDYWVKRDPLRTHAAYDQFMTLADALHEKYYNTFGYGFESDRAMIYLKYGPPTRIATRHNDQSAVPYEIWSYDRIDYTSQTNVKFVFYNPTLAGNDFILLHSNCRNELNNPKWLQYIYTAAPDELEGDNYRDARGIQDNFGREAARLFNDN